MHRKTIHMILISTRKLNHLIKRQMNKEAHLFSQDIKIVFRDQTIIYWKQFSLLWNRSRLILRAPFYFSKDLVGLLLGEMSQSKHALK